MHYLWLLVTAYFGSTQSEICQNLLRKPPEIQKLVLEGKIREQDGAQEQNGEQLRL